MKQQIRVSYFLCGKKSTKNYSTEKGAFRSVYNWLSKNIETSDKEVTFFINGEFHRYTNIEEVPYAPESKPSDFYKTTAWLQLRVKALTTLERKCVLCGKTKQDGISLEVDHIIPRSIAPQRALDFDNLQILCSACNRGKSNHYSDDWS